MSEIETQPRDTIPDHLGTRIAERHTTDDDTSKTDLSSGDTDNDTAKTDLSSGDTDTEHFSGDEETTKTDLVWGLRPTEPPPRSTDEDISKTKPGWSTCPSEPRLAVTEDTTKTDVGVGSAFDTLRPNTFSSAPPAEITRVGIGPGLTPLYPDELLDAAEEPEHQPRIHPKPPFLPTDPGTKTKR
jgi:hypothetical protein